MVQIDLGITLLLRKKNNEKLLYKKSLACIINNVKGVFETQKRIV